MWWIGASMVALSLILLACQVCELRRAAPSASADAPPKPPPRRPLQVVSLLLVVVNVPIGTLVALGDENLGPWAVGHGYAVLGLLTWGAQLAVLAIALSLWLLARRVPARSRLAQAGIWLSWLVVAGVGICYGLFAGM